jgi:hypothetical protein
VTEPNPVPDKSVFAMLSGSAFGGNKRDLKGGCNKEQNKIYAENEKLLVITYKTCIS